MEILFYFTSIIHRFENSFGNPAFNINTSYVYLYVI